MRDNRLYESLQGLGVQKPEHEMGYPYGMKALQLADHFGTASGREVSIPMRERERVAKVVPYV
jgi:hypothetical protein